MSIRQISRFFLATAMLVVLLASSAAVAAQTHKASGETTPAQETAEYPGETVQSVIRRVYRLLVEYDGAVKGGTGFLVSGQRIVATNHHVVNGGKSYSVGFIDEHGAVKRIPLRLLAVFPQKDLALLEALDDLPGVPLPLSHDYPAVATDLFAIGFPAAADPRGGLSWAQSDDTTFFIPSVLKGYVSRVLTNRWFSSQLQHQTPIIPGYSGGPLIDHDGTVLAISTAIHKDANGISYGVLASDLADFIDACSLPATVISSDVIANLKRERSVERPPSEAPKRPKPPQQLDRTAKEMLTRGFDFLERGDIVAARLVFRYLVDRRNLPHAYSGLAKTYDPLYLNKKKVIGISGDVAKARIFYEKAAKLNGTFVPLSFGLNSESEPAGGCNGSVCNLVNTPDGPSVVCQKSDSLPTYGTKNAR